MTSQTQAHLLVVDDDERIRGLLQKFLMRNGFLVTIARDAAQARRLLGGLEFDLIVLDVMMPGEDGIALTRELRQRHTVPILLLTARGETASRLEGFEAGADDYLVKPFDMREMEARLRAVVRRPAGHFTSVLQLGQLELDAAGRTVSRAGRLFDLGRREFGLLEALMTHAGRVVTRERLMSRLSDLEDGGSDNALELLVSRLRRKIAGSGVEVVTVRGVGYLLREAQNDGG